MPTRGPALQGAAVRSSHGESSSTKVSLPGRTKVLPEARIFREMTKQMVKRAATTTYRTPYARQDTPHSRGVHPQTAVFPSGRFLTGCHLARLGSFIAAAGGASGERRLVLGDERLAEIAGRAAELKPRRVQIINDLLGPELDRFRIRRLRIG
jgi:hypothetical protein